MLKYKEVFAPIFLINAIIVYIISINYERI